MSPSNFPQRAQELAEPCQPLQATLVERRVASKDVHVFVSRTCEYVTYMAEGALQQDEVKAL